MSSESKKSEKAANRSSDKLLRILECLAKNSSPMRLQDLSTQVNINQATVLRYLQTLQNTNYVFQDEMLRYSLTWKLCQLTETLDSYGSLRSICSPYINELASGFQVGVCLVVNQNQECLYLDCVDYSPSVIYTLQRVGKSAPLHATGSGKILLSTFSEAQIDEYISKKGLNSLTKYTITTKEALMADLETIRQNGYSQDDEECEIGLRCFSMPLKKYSGKTVAALSVFGNAFLLTEAVFKSNIYSSLKQVTNLVSERLGYSGKD